MPWVRAVATSKARPALASQAENANSIRADEENAVAARFKVHRERPRNKDNIIPSKQSSADSKWVR